MCFSSKRAKMNDNKKVKQVKIFNYQHERSISGGTLVDSTKVWIMGAMLVFFAARNCAPVQKQLSQKNFMCKQNFSLKVKSWNDCFFFHNKEFAKCSEMRARERKTKTSAPASAFGDEENHVSDFTPNFDWI